MEKVFHKDCTRCKGSIVFKRGYGIMDGQPYCKVCVTKIHSEKQQIPEKLCGNCGKQFSGSCVAFQVNIYHKDCFKPPKQEQNLKWVRPQNKTNKTNQENAMNVEKHYLVLAFRF